jgi:formylglycine-generating enzyme
MKPPVTALLESFVFASIALSTSALAVVNIDYVPVGHAGNAADPLSRRGSVSYNYNIGKYEVTNAQYSEFLNAADPSGTNSYGLYNTLMGSNLRGGISFDAGAANGSKYSTRANMGNKPVTWVSWFDAARFTNWMHNGQGNGSTETGAYTLNGAMTGTNFAREVGATVWLPSVDEWHKAAFYDPTVGAGGGDNYWFYPTQSDATPTVAAADSFGNVSNPGANVANYNFGADWNGQDGNLTTVGSAAANNYFGTFDQAGNAREWSEGSASNGTNRFYRGGSFSASEIAMQSTRLVGPVASNEQNDLGFRVASIPEPTAPVLAALSLLIGLRRRRQ